MTTPRRSSSHVVSTRLSAKQFRAAKRLFARRGLSPSAYTRRMLTALSGDPKAARAMLDDLLAAIGVPPDASKADALEALEELFEGIDMDDVPADDGEPLAEAPDDPAPVESFAARGAAARLTDRERAECAKRGITPAAFLKAKAGAARRLTPAKAAPSKPTRGKPSKLSAGELAHCKRRGIDPKDFAAKKAAAARRA